MRLVTDCASQKRLDLLFVPFFFSYNLFTCERWTIIQIFTRILLKLDAIHQKGEHNFFFSTFRISFSTSSTQSDWMRAKLYQFQRKNGREATFCLCLLLFFASLILSIAWNISVRHEIRTWIVLAILESQVEIKDSLTWICLIHWIQFWK